MIFSSGVSAAICVFCSCMCAFPYIYRALHMYQLNSYQNLSYGIWLKQNRRELFRPGKIALCAALAVCAFTLSWGASAALAVLMPIRLLKKSPAKKPLVFTARVKRMLVTFAVLSLALSAVMLIPVTDAVLRAFAAAAAALFAAFQHRFVMLICAINSPVERAVSRRYVNEARDILRSLPRLKIIGITGSYGKTSTKHFLSELLSTRMSVYMTPGNFNTTLGVVRAVREGLRPTHDVFLCEMGARHRGDIAEICELVRPHMGVLTYIGQQHMETFGSQQAITDTKLELARAVDRIYVNIDSEIAAVQQYSGERVFYGSGEKADYRAADVEISARGLSFTVTAPNGERGLFSTKLLGRANVQNLTGAIAVAHSMGIPFSALVPAVRALKSVAHRLELKQTDKLTIIDDAYNSNPEGAKIALQTLAMCTGYKIAVTPGLIELGELEREQNMQLGKLAAQSCDLLITVGKNTGALVALGAREAGMVNIFEAIDINTAMQYASNLAQRDKIVLLLNDLPDNY